MPDPLEINDLSHLSDEEFMALCPIGEHAPGPEPLSPAAQAVLDAFVDAACGSTYEMHHGLAAVLRAAADQVVPEESLHGGDQRWMFERDARQERRKKLLAIAAELEGGTTPPFP